MNEEQLLENFFTGILSMEDQKYLQVLLESNPKFAAEFAFQKHLKKAITFNEREALKKKLQFFDATVPDVKPSILGF
ncbi:MAG: hypothetical protein I4O51_00205 [Flavobacterium micromati]|jgi:hypothetical protein|nr:hypothetical protein [Flavobacterium micromati]